MTGEQLAMIRLRLGMTQAKLAEVLGVPQSTICRWETGKIRIERPRMLVLALEAIAIHVDRERFVAALNAASQVPGTR